MTVRPLASTGAVALAGLALWLAAPTPARAWDALAAAAQAQDVGQPLVAAASLLAWALLTHLVLVGVLTLSTRLPGRSGSAGEAVLRRCAPAPLRRLVALALGAGLLVGTGAGVATAAPTPTPDAISLDWGGVVPETSDQPNGLTVDWPTPAGAADPAAPVEISPALPGAAAPSPEPSPERHKVPVPAPASPAAGPATPTGSTGVPTPAAPDPSASTAAPSAPSASPQGAAALESLPAPAPDALPPSGTGPVPATAVPQPGSVVVSAGDSLWSLARASLPAGADDRQVAQAWPSWWSANRDVIGDDPDLLHPGQTLRTPR